MNFLIQLKCNAIPQYGQRNCLILHGLNSSDLLNCHANYKGFLDKVLGTINQHQSLDLNHNCIDIAHPLPPAKNGKIPTIIKFLKRSDRNLVYQMKKQLLHTGLAFTESLTKKKLALLKEARALARQDNVWTFNGTIYCNRNSHKEAIKSKMICTYSLKNPHKRKFC